LRNPHTRRPFRVLSSRPALAGSFSAALCAFLMALAILFVGGRALARQQTREPAAARASQPLPSTQPALPPGTLHPRQDAQNAYEPRTAPGAGQVFLAKFAGDWDVVKTFYPQKGEPVRTNGECLQKMAHEGHFLESDFVFFDKDGGRTTGTGISGFDEKSGRFTTVWYDSRGTTFSMRQSEGPFDGKEIVLYAASFEPAKPGRHSITRSHLEQDGRVLVHRHYLVQEDGKERLMMELLLTRKAPAAAHLVGVRDAVTHS
jgi:hypothetical protein